MLYIVISLPFFTAEVPCIIFPCKAVFLMLNLLSSFFRFEDYFSNRVKQLTYTFPEDAATSTGSPFWSAPKRFPRPLQFSSSDPAHLQLVMAGSILRAETFGISVPDWAKSPKKLADFVSKIIVPDFEPKKDVKIVTDEKATSVSTASTDDVAVIKELVAKLEDCAKNLAPGYRMNPVQFEKVCFSSVCTYFLKLPRLLNFYIKYLAFFLHSG